MPVVALRNLIVLLCWLHEAIFFFFFNILFVSIVIMHLVLRISNKQQHCFLLPRGYYFQLHDVHISWFYIIKKSVLFCCFGFSILGTKYWLSVVETEDLSLFHHPFTLWTYIFTIFYYSSNYIYYSFNSIIMLSSNI